MGSLTRWTLFGWDDHPKCSWAAKGRRDWVQVLAEKYLLYETGRCRKQKFIVTAMTRDRCD